MKGIGGPALDQPEPIDVGDIVATHKLPCDPSKLGYFLSRLAEEWDGYTLSVRTCEFGVAVYVESIESETSDDG